MSLDDKFLRDPRVVQLAQKLGLTKYDVRGRLLEVWAICYDRETPLVLPRDVDVAAEWPGFAAAMVEVELAKGARGNRMIRISGAQERIAYLHNKRRAASVGGAKSAETRENGVKHGGSGAQAPGFAVLKHGGNGAQARGNPSVPDTVPDPVPDPVPDQEGVLRGAMPPAATPRPLAEVPRARRGSGAQRSSRASKTAMPADWQPTAAHVALAQERGLSIAHETERFRAWTSAGDYRYASWDAAFRNHLYGARPTSRSAIDVQLDRVAMLEAREREAGGVR